MSQQAVKWIGEEQRDEAIHVSASGEMDCFATLAMTVERMLLRQT